MKKDSGEPTNKRRVVLSQRAFKLAKWTSGLRGVPLREVVSGWVLLQGSEEVWSMVCAGAPEPDWYRSAWERMLHPAPGTPRDLPLPASPSVDGTGTIEADEGQEPPF